MEEIKSRDNKLIKHIRKLNTKKYRQQNHEFIIEGLRFVEEAVMSGAAVRYCLYSKNIKDSRVRLLLERMQEMKTAVYPVDDRLLYDICDTDSPQGIVAVIKKEYCDMDSVLNAADFVVAVDRIQDPGNLGTIIRSADAAGAGAVVIWEGTVDPYSPKSLRSTMGSIFHIPVLCFDNADHAVASLKTRGFEVFAASLEMSTPYYSEDFRGKVAVVIGNEANGISSGIITCADRLINIPMPGSAESLNAAVAAGILIFEVVRQRITVDK